MSVVGEVASDLIGEEMPHQLVAMAELQEPPQRAGVERERPAPAEADVPALGDELQQVAVGADRGLVVDADPAITGDEDRRRDVALDHHALAGDQAADHGGAAGERELAAVADRDVAPGACREIALPVAGRRVSDVTVCAGRHGDGLGGIARRERQRHAADRGHVSEVDLATVVAAGGAVAVEVTDDRGRPCLGAVWSVALAGGVDVGTSGRTQARVGIVAEDREELTGRAHAVADRLAVLAEVGVSSAEHPAAARPGRLLAVHPEVAPGLLEVEVLEGRAPLGEREVVRQVTVECLSCESERGQQDE